MSLSTRNNRGLFFLLILILSACNLPAANDISPTEAEIAVLWDLSVPGAVTGETSSQSTEIPVRPTATPQLYKAVDFSSAFSSSFPITESEAVSFFGTGEDSAQWLYFEPAEYSPQQIDTLYAVFKNTGQREWNERYYLDFFAGTDPTDGKSVYPDSATAPEGQAVFRIPIKSDAASWKACWHLKNPEGRILYEFCYNHGTGENKSASVSGSSADSSPSGSGETFWGFVKRNGNPPAKVSTDELSASFISTSPANQHTFKAYDHVENFSVSFVNEGTATWDSSYSLRFYSGYNWFHTDSFSLQQTVAQGETATFTVPMEIIEDNDKWVTCWYLSTPDGQNLSDFCFNYYTKS